MRRASLLSLFALAPLIVKANVDFVTRVEKRQQVVYSIPDYKITGALDPQFLTTSGSVTKFIGPVSGHLTSHMLLLDWCNTTLQADWLSYCNNNNQLSRYTINSERERRTLHRQREWQQWILHHHFASSTGQVELSSKYKCQKAAIRRAFTARTIRHRAHSIFHGDCTFRHHCYSCGRRRDYHLAWLPGTSASSIGNKSPQQLPRWL